MKTSNWIENCLLNIVVQNVLSLTQKEKPQLNIFTVELAIIKPEKLTQISVFTSVQVKLVGWLVFVLRRINHFWFI